MATPWDEPATVDLYVLGLDRQRAAFTGTLRDAVIFTLSQANERGDGYIIRLDDGSASWEGAEIAELGRDLA
ncbi:hypothetical protein HZY97_20270 [Sphingomonas sp. R-74633]|uniref:hypothetical protein n=1 Tax=Sphingomonas sp. R-74633 TaxID=2751188 RepID=UPI0015D2050A|nr:hypothetical protein [Sphingomonas sp. R-74633]NYT43122.1 hypothetical protein [Sphingomonas sp. R-74633]